MSSISGNGSGNGHGRRKRAREFGDLPREVIRGIIGNIYNPMELTQKDRLTWGIFSTTDMDPDREADLASLIAFGSTCRAVRRVVRVSLFRCIRVESLERLDEVVAARRDWAMFVKSCIIDLTMFESPNSPPPPWSNDLTALVPPDAFRNPWIESALLVSLLNVLPSLEHLSFFADASDDTTLSLAFAALIPHPSTHPIPPPTQPNSPRLEQDPIGYYEVLNVERKFLPLSQRLCSFGWRQRSPPPEHYRTFNNVPTFNSTMHLLRHAHRLSFLVLDADMGYMDPRDILLPILELRKREAPTGEEAQLVSCMICGPINAWGPQFVEALVTAGDGVINELFIDGPISRHHAAEEPEKVAEDVTSILTAFRNFHSLQILQIGSYPIDRPEQFRIIQNFVPSTKKLLSIGLNDREGRTVWWAIWRERQREREHKRQRRLSVPVTSMTKAPTIEVRELQEGDLAKLEEELGGGWDGRRRSYARASVSASAKHSPAPALGSGIS